VTVGEDFDDTNRGRRSLGHRATASMSVRLTDSELIGLALSEPERGYGYGMSQPASARAAGTGPDMYVELGQPEVVASIHATFELERVSVRGIHGVGGFSVLCSIEATACQ
jgi:hypothetical protein